MARRESNHLTRLEKVKVLAAIYLITRGSSQKGAVEVLRKNTHYIDEPLLTELLRVARNLGWIWEESLFNVAPEALPEGVDAQLLEEARAYVSDRVGLAERLRRTGTGTLRDVHVYYSGGEDKERDSKERWAARLESFARLASKQVLRSLTRAHKVGVGWGHTVASLVQALNTPAVKRSKKLDVKFVPTCGEPLRPSGPEHHPERASTHLAAALSDLFCAKGNDRRLTLAGVVAVEPKAFRTPERKAVLREYFNVISDYRTIFGPGAHPPLIDEIDTILTSVGSFDQDWKLYTSELDRAAGIPREELAASFKGDIGGAIIPAQHPTRAQQRQYDIVASCWTGITVDHYKRIAADAVRNGRPGVIVAAIGSSKAEIVLEVVRLGLVNELIIDHALAERLEALTS
ncbi:MAG TPA: hypothetical protein VI670_07975 [Thermoanaerobaculia bacterium]|jgi:DNA-binding transcriptional regulator LsrR (DeoR family)